MREKNSVLIVEREYLGKYTTKELVERIIKYNIYKEKKEVEGIKEFR